MKRRVVLSCLLAASVVVGCDDEDGGAVDGGVDAAASDGPVLDGPAVMDSLGDGPAGAEAGDAPAAPTGPPMVTKVIPQVIVAGGPVYVYGTNFGTMADVAAGRLSVVLALEMAPGDGGTDGGGDGGTVMPLLAEITLQILEVHSTYLVALVPANVGGIMGRVKVVVRTQLGASESQAPTTVVESSGFGGATMPGQGLLGRVYQLQPNTPNLPDFAMPCMDPKVINLPPASPCPFSAFLVPNLAVTLRSFTAGFPGVQADLVEWFAIRFTGKIVIATAGMYTFQSCSDDGSKVYVDGTMVLDVDGVHPRSCASGMATLTAGEHGFVVEYFQGPRTEIGLEVFWTPPGGVQEIIPPTAFRLDLAELATGP